MERLVIDFTELPECYATQNRWILVIIDHMSSYVWGECFPTKSAVPVALKLLSIVREYGPCEILSSDNGREFVNCAMEVRSLISLVLFRV